MLTIVVRPHMSILHKVIVIHKLCMNIYFYEVSSLKNTSSYLHNSVLLMFTDSQWAPLSIATGEIISTKYYSTFIVLLSNTNSHFSFTDSRPSPALTVLLKKYYSISYLSPIKTSTVHFHSYIHLPIQFCPFMYCLLWWLLHTPFKSWKICININYLLSIY